MKQCTIQKTITFEGKGLHTGVYTIVEVNPAETNHGIQFLRSDLEEAKAFRADVSNVQATNRCTVIGKGDASVSTVEHLLSALVAKGISNVLIKVSGPEIPILDGSSIPFIQEIESVGVEVQSENLDVFKVEEPIFFKDEVSGAEYTIFPADTYSITTLADFNSKVVGQQFAQLDDLKDYPQEIAPARTFAFLHELEPLLEQGLIKGGDVDNALVFVEEMPSKTKLENLAKQFNKEILTCTEEGILDTTQLRFSNEVARHKLLDVIGDLALVTVPIQAKIIAKKPGHKGNIALAKKLKSIWKKQVKEAAIPQYDPKQKVIYDINDISAKLQHRYPFLLIDKVIEISDKHVVGVKNVTMNEPFFTGHFPGNPVMPGVLQIEAMAQTGGILVTETIEDPHNWDTYFLRINNARFRKMVIPGDTLVFRLELISPIRRGLCEMQAKAYVAGQLVAEAELLAQIIRRK